MKSSDFPQIKKQQEVIRRMRFAWSTPDRKYMATDACPGMSQIVFAFDSQCSQQTLSEWFNEEKALDAICIVGKFTMMRDPNTGEVETVQADAEHAEVVHFVSKVYTTILLTHRKLIVHPTIQTPDGNCTLNPDIGAYLTFDVPYPDSESDSNGE